jgi:hypothetical protein
MAIYLRIVKVDDTPTHAEYTFMNSTEDRVGRFQIDKESGETVLIENMPGDGNGHMFSRAAYKVKKAFQSGELPELTIYAA